MRFTKTHVLYAALLLPLAFDFRGETAGGVWQISITIATLFAGSLLLLRNGIQVAGRFWQIIIFLLLVAFAGGVLTSVLNGLPTDSIVRALGPMALLVLGFFIGAGAISQNTQDQLLQWLYIGCGISVVFSFAIGLSGQVALADIRYQILSSVVLMFQALLLHQIFVTRENALRASILLVGCLLIQLLSATRSNIVGVLMVGLAAIWITSGSASRFIRNGAAKLLALVALGIFSLYLGTIVVPDIVDRWVLRVFSFQEHGVDITAVARVAEMHDQIDRWSSDLFSIIVGKGYGAEYGLASAYLPELAVAMSSSEGGYTSRAPGHNFFVYSLFAGGLLFGIALPIALLWATVKGATLARRLLKNGRYNKLMSSLTAATLILVGTFGQAVGGNPLGPRYSGLVIGLAMGMLVASHAYLRRAQRSQVAVDGRPPIRHISGAI